MNTNVPTSRILINDDNVSSFFSPGDNVTLHLDGHVVGHAELQPPPSNAENKTVSRRIHGNDLAEIEHKNGYRDKYLVAIWRIHIHNAAKSLHYPYNFPAPEPCPRKLCEIFLSGFNVWDCNSMTIRN